MKSKFSTTWAHLILSGINRNGVRRPVNSKKYCFDQKLAPLSFFFLTQTLRPEQPVSQKHFTIHIKTRNWNIWWVGTSHGMCLIRTLNLFIHWVWPEHTTYLYNVFTLTLKVYSCPLFIFKHIFKLNNVFNLNPPSSAQCVYLQNHISCISCVQLVHTIYPCCVFILNSQFLSHSPWTHSLIASPVHSQLYQTMCLP